MLQISVMFLLLTLIWAQLQLAPAYENLDRLARMRFPANPAKIGLRKQDPG